MKKMEGTLKKLQKETYYVNYPQRKPVDILLKERKTGDNLELNLMNLMNLKKNIKTK